jgi:hypothetical protein
MQIQVKIKGARQTSRMFLNLGPELNKSISQGSKEFLDSVRRGAMIMAPRLTGRLVQSMVVRPGLNRGEWIFSVGEGLRHALPTELGYRPHLVSSSAEAYPGITIAEVYGIPEGVTLLVTGSRRMNFVRDAFQNALARLPEIMERKTKKAIQRARRIR